VTKEEERMSRTTPADVIFVRRGSKYRAEPPSHKVHPLSKDFVCFRNLTGYPVWVWFPGDFLIGSPALIVGADEDRCFNVNPAAAAGSYPYSAYVSGANDFVEGNSPPEIIIDR
jgi:hypothetical protein